MKRTLFSLLLFSLLRIHANSQEDLNALIQSKVEAVFESKSIPGILVGVSVKGKHNFFTAGFADKEKKALFTPATQFEIGSITKTFTTYLLVAILKKYNIADSSSITKFLPDSVKVNPSISSIQFIQLLNHTSGLPRLPDNLTAKGYFFQPYASYKKEDLYSYLRKAKPKNIGKDNYSNLGLGLAGVLAENSSGKSYEQLLKKYIIKPAKLKNTSIYVNEKSVKAVGYFDKQIAPYWDMSILVGAGGIKSDATDMLNYLDYISNHTSKPLIASILQKTAMIDKKTYIAKGWHTNEKNNETQFFWHNGGTYGFSTFCAFNPKNKNSIIIVINSFSKNFMADQLGFELMDTLLD
jgi:CubicO group peptidase (beta-lactamase class C family)